MPHTLPPPPQQLDLLPAPSVPPAANRGACVTPTPRPSTISPDCALRLALEAWKPYHNPPRLLSVSNLGRMIAELTAALVPADDGAYARALTKLIEFAMAFGIPCGDPAAVQRIYREKLADLPEDLLACAVVRVTDRWTWGQRLPMPAEIRSTISQDLTHRRVLRTRAELALMKARSLPPPSTAKPGTIPPEKWAELRASLSAKHKSNRTHQDTTP